jgi:hypothetical protein
MYLIYTTNIDTIIFEIIFNNIENYGIEHKPPQTSHWIFTSKLSNVTFLVDIEIWSHKTGGC